MGFRGTEDLGGGLKAVFTLENGFGRDSGTLNQGNRLFGRQAWVGLSGQWGTLTLGWAKSHSLHTGQTPVMKYNRQLMQAILWDKIKIAGVVGVQVITLDQALEGYGSFDAGAPKKFVIDPHKMLQNAA